MSDRPPRRAAVLTAALLAAAPAAACSSGATEPGAVLTVSAASSLTEVFTALGDRFEAENPGVDVRLNFGGSSALAEQIVAGAPVDVFAAASSTTMAEVVDAGDAGEPVDFATNRLAVAVPVGNPAGVRDVSDLARPGLSVVVCAPDVPCGAAASQLLQENALDVTPVSLEPDVRSVLTKVVADEADAGVVYVTDVAAAAGTVESVDIPVARNVPTTYPIAVIEGSTAPELGRSFVALVTSPEGRRALAVAGFGPP